MVRREHDGRTPVGSERPSGVAGGGGVAGVVHVHDAGMDAAPGGEGRAVAGGSAGGGGRAWERDRSRDPSRLGLLLRRGAGMREMLVIVPGRYGLEVCDLWELVARISEDDQDERPVDELVGDAAIESVGM